MHGSTKKRGNTWTAYWFTTDRASGKRRQHSKGGFRIQRDAQRHLHSIMDEVGQGAWRPDSKLTVGELLTDHWLPARASSRAGRQHGRLLPGRHPVDRTTSRRPRDVRELTPGRVATMVASLRASGSRKGRGGLSTRSVQLTVTVLKAATAWAVGAGLLGRDPLKGYERPRSSSKPMTSWSADEARAFLEGTADDRLAFAWAIDLARGFAARRAVRPALGKRRPDGRGPLDPSDPHRRGRKVIDSLPKTARYQRSIPLDPQLVALLRRPSSSPSPPRRSSNPSPSRWPSSTWRPS